MAAVSRGCKPRMALIFEATEYHKGHKIKSKKYTDGENKGTNMFITSTDNVTK